MIFTRTGNDLKMATQLLNKKCQLGKWQCDPLWETSDYR